MTINFYNADGHRIKEKVNAVMLCLFEFKWIRRHLRLASAIDHRHLLRSKSNRLSCRIDCSISAADDYDLMPHRDFVQWFGMNLLDKIQGIKTLWKIFPIDSNSIPVTKSEPQEHRMEIALQFFAADIASNFDSAANFNAEIFHKFCFIQTQLGLQLVISDSVCIQSTWQL